jgi:FtsP/CotA-like multicopper oxidase with cupredoxin domain
MESTVGSAIMRTRKLTSGFGAAALAVTALGLSSGEAMAAEFWLRAGPTTVNLPDPLSTTGGTLPVAMWGYASCPDGTFANCGPVTVPGPALLVPAGDSQLKVNLQNTLPVATSLVINGLYKPMAPVWSDGSSGPRSSPAQRVRSFDAEAAAVSGTATYTWVAKPGTYLYQSGTQPQVQVQMGLYGAVKGNAVDADPGAATPVRAQAYAGALNAYDNQATLLYSEVDPVLHAAVADGSYGTTGPTSTFDYQPKYFLVNGAPFVFGSTAPVMPTASGDPAGTTLLRLLNAGLTTHVPTIQGLHWDLIAEDGKPYSFKRSQYTALLPAAKTMDVLLTPDVGGGSYAIVDRRLSLSNAGLPNGGMLAVLQYGPSGVAGAPLPGDTNLPPLALADNYSGIAGVELSVGAAQGVLANDNDTDGLPQVMRAVAASGTTIAGGSYVLNANGSFTYAPPTAGSTDSFNYTITDGKAISSPATVTISLSAPVAPTLGVALDDFNRVPLGDPLGVNWAQSTNVVLAADGVGGTGAAAAAIDLGGQAIWIADSDPSATGDTSILGATQYAGLTASPLEKLGLILKATGGNTKDAPVNFVRVRMEGGNIVVSTQVGGANTSVYVKQAAFPAGAASGTLSAVVDAKGLVTVFLNGVFKGGVQLPDVGAWKGGGRIGMQLQTPSVTVDNFSGGSL